MSISESSSDSSYSDDYAELRRRWCSQEDLSVKSPLESSDSQLPLDNYDGTTCSTPLQHTPVSVWQLQSSQPSISPIFLDSPGPRLPYYDPHVPPPPLAMQSPGTEPKMPFYNPHIPPPSLSASSSSSSLRDSSGAVLSSQTSPRPSRQDSFGAVLSSSQALPLSSAQGSFGAVQTPSQTSPLSSTGGTSRTMPSLLQTSPLSSTWDSGAAMEPAQVKRVTDEEWPLVKRSRSGPDAGDGFARLSGTQPHVFRGGLQWRGPSTYRMYCMQQDEGGDKDRQVLDMFCYQEEDTAEVVFRPKFLTPTSQPATPTRPKRSQRQLSRWAPRSASTPSSEMALTTAPNMPLLSKRWPYSVPPKVGLVDSHCHLDFIFSRRHMWGSLLAEDGVWGAFGCHPHMASEYNNDIEDDLVYALDHPSVVALGEIGLDYSYKNQCDHNVQKAVFRKQLKLALNRKLPLVIHSRDSTQDTIDILKEATADDAQPKTLSRSFLVAIFWEKHSYTPPQARERALPALRHIESNKFSKTTFLK
ncbi:hypothetical protein HPB51_011783 [Rhipicephalus microplus]|uniref:Uncharacterized protein n=1 Tax=Rhipicephalus microplus TaxID=6941 RepID=A0A9J6DFT1_RHIMP|nr:hypothetical protein HPB51_011783 [Rhipicephalus microplus]